MRSKFCQNRDFVFRVKDLKLRFQPGLRISIFAKIQILTKKQKSATVVYHNFGISQNYQNQNFLKLIRIWAHKCDKLFSKILKSLWTQNSSKSLKFRKIGSNHQNFQEKILKTQRVVFLESDVGAKIARAFQKFRFQRINFFLDFLGLKI